MPRFAGSQRAAYPNIKAEGFACLLEQMIVEKAYSAQAMGTKPDHIRAALDLFIDFWAIFVRLLFILLRNAERREERDGRNRKRRP